MTRGGDTWDSNAHSGAEGVQLSRELQDIMKAQDPGLGADAVQDDVYLWDVWLSGFDPGSDLAEVQQQEPNS